MTKMLQSKHHQSSLFGSDYWPHH